MAKRPRAYYAKWQITEGLLASTEEWMFRDTKEEYTGPYHKYVDGTVMTGGSYNESTSEYLVPYVNYSKNPSLGIYEDIRSGEDVKKYKPPVRYNPRNHLELKDYKRTWFERYFVRRRNHVNGEIIEVNKKQFKSLPKKGSGLNGNLYIGISLRWRIAGPLESTVIDGVKHFGIADANKQALFFAENKMTGITKYLGFLEEFSIYSKLTDPSITDELL
jgi:hypothetical protein